jgi:hypothetical protein
MKLSKLMSSIIFKIEDINFSKNKHDRFIMHFMIFSFNLSLILYNYQISKSNIKDLYRSYQ